ncbi:MAG: hypothetical protein AAFY05_25330 [Pseudomonadota bacterium]
MDRTSENTEIAVPEFAGETSADHLAAEDGFLSGLSDEHRSLAAANGWQDAASVLEDYQALQGALTGSVQVPGKEASPEERSEFYAEVSKSWTPKDGYRFKMPETLPHSFPYDQAFAQEAGGWFKEAGLHPEAAQQLHDRWVSKMAEQFSAQEESANNAARAQQQAAESAHQDLVRDYGTPESDGYQNAVARADRALTGLKSAGIDLTDWFAEKGALSKADRNGLQQVVDPVAVKLLTFIHDRAFAEDGLSGVSEGASGGNPFDQDSLDLKLQSELLDRNPARARQMILAAGRDPKMFRV